MNTLRILVRQMNANLRRELEDFLMQPFADDDQLLLTVIKPSVSAPVGLLRIGAIEYLRRVLLQIQESTGCSPSPESVVANVTLGHASSLRPIRITLDPRVIIAALTERQNHTREMLLRLYQSPHVVVLSEMLLTELRRLLRDPSNRSLHQLGDDDIETFVVAIRQASEVLELCDLAGDVVPPGAAYDTEHSLIETATLGKVQMLCTSNACLLLFYEDSECGFRIVSDSEILQWL